MVVPAGRYAGLTVAARTRAAWQETSKLRRRNPLSKVVIHEVAVATATPVRKRLHPIADVPLAGRSDL
jgi:hypothetical protein